MSSSSTASSEEDRHSAQEAGISEVSVREDVAVLVTAQGLRTLFDKLKAGCERLAKDDESRIGLSWVFHSTVKDDARLLGHSLIWAGSSVEDRATLISTILSFGSTACGNASVYASVLHAGSVVRGQAKVLPVEIDGFIRPSTLIESQVSDNATCEGVSLDDCRINDYTYICDSYLSGSLTYGGTRITQKSIVRKGSLDHMLVINGTIALPEDSGNLVAMTSGSIVCCGGIFEGEYLKAGSIICTDHCMCHGSDAEAYPPIIAIAGGPLEGIDDFENLSFQDQLQAYIDTHPDNSDAVEKWKKTLRIEHMASVAQTPI